MSVRIAQSRISPGSVWFIAILWAVIAWLWSPEEIVTNCVIFGVLCVIALYFTYEHWRFPDSILVVATPPAPGHAFRGRIETPMPSEPASGFKVRLEAVYVVRRNKTIVWHKEPAAHPSRGDRGVIVPIEVAIPRELASDARPRIWVLSVRALVPLAIYRAKFVLTETAESVERQ